MSFDLGPLLQNWDFTPGQVTVRKVTGEDGKQKLQLRLDLGLLQMEVDGRPDGQRPMDHESLLLFYEDLARSFDEQHKGSYKFKLDSEDCVKLQQEAVQYYHRYLAFFQLGDWERVIRDTQRNLDLFDFVEQHAETRDLAALFQQFRPYVLMMRSRARAQQLIEKKQNSQAIAEIKACTQEIKAFLTRYQMSEMIDQSHEIRFLENWQSELEKYGSFSDREKIEEAMAAAVAREDYEMAAMLRDSLRQIIP